MTDHALLAPSSAHRWLICPGSVAMEAAVPEEDSEESREGTAAHWVAQMLLMTGWLPDVGEPAPNGYVVDEPMREGAQMYVEHVYSVLGDRSPQHVESRTQPGAIHELCWGTPDADDRNASGLDLFDYKYGHRFVEVFENAQLTCYAADLLAQLDGLQDQLTPVRFHIVQPRSFHRDGPIRSWACKASDLRPLVNRLRAAACEALKPNAPTLATPGACRDCRARTRCPAAQEAGLEAAAVAGTSVPFDLAPAEAGRYLALVQRAKKQLDAMESGLEEQLLKTLLKGGQVPGWIVASSKPREVWTAKPEDVFALGDMYGKQLRAPAAPVTPAAARKLGIDESVISEYSTRPKGQLRVAPMDFTQAKKLFGRNNP